MADAPEAAQQRFTRAFVDADLESDYRRETARRMRKTFRVFSMLTLVVYVVITLVEPHMIERLTWLGTPANEPALTRIRWVLSLPLLAICAVFGWSREKPFVRHWNRVWALNIAALALVPLLSAHWMPAPQLVDTGTSSMSLLAVLIAGCLLAPLRFINAVALVSLFIPVFVFNNATIHYPPGIGATTFWFFFAASMAVFGAWQVEASDRRAFLQWRAVAIERTRSDRLLRNMLPEPIAERLKSEPGAIADAHDAVTVLFADIVGFTPLSAKMQPRELVDLLNRVFSAFDELARRHGLEKIKTIGDAYMVVGGLPSPRADHAAAVAAMALEMREKLAAIGDGLALRIGLHSGPVVAGVIGTAKYSYDLWGDTVNTASRMESHGAPGEIHVSGACKEALGDRFAVEERGVVDIKGKGPMQTFWLRGQR